MFDSEFFPTPKAVIDMMLAPYKSKYGLLTTYTSILEPSAGKGDILDYIADGCCHRALRLYAIERNPELAYILQGKKYRVLANDFLEYRPEHRFDLIVMNPPFSVGAEHLLHAWDILHSGDIVCLLNAETLANPCTRERQLLAEIIREHGTVEQLGDCFRTAERKTDVQVALVRLTKASAEDDLRFEFSLPDDVEEDDGLSLDGDHSGTGLARVDHLGAMLRQYDETKRAFVGYCRAIEGMKFFSEGICAGKVLDIAAASHSGSEDNRTRLNDFTDSLRLEAWRSILDKLGIDKYLTKGLREKFKVHGDAAGSLALTRENIRSIVSQIMLNVNTIMQQAVVDVFDVFTRYHEDNRIHIEGWKTNSAWKVNRKVILPYWIRYDSGLRVSFALQYAKWDDYADIDKVMCWLTGKRIEDIVTISQALEASFSSDASGKCRSEFFECRYFKKGTLHIVFRDENLWAKFNSTACKGKNWIGGNK